jgi:hypothetical protein
MSGIARPT